MKRKALLSVIPLVLTLAACGTTPDESAQETTKSSETTAQVNKEGMPIVDEKVEMTVFTGTSAQNAGHDWNDIFIWNEYEKMTNIDMQFDNVQTEALVEQRNLSLVNNETPDIFFLANFPNTDLYRYGSQGVFLPLNDYLEEYAPNLTKLMEEYPLVKASMTFPDGNIYSMPSVIEEDYMSFRIASRPWINQVWLDELGLKVPETTEEFYDYLVAVKELDPAGNGDTIPLGGTSVNEIIQYLAGSFGVMNNGNRPDNGLVDIDPDTGDMRFYPTTDGYRELLEYANKLYTEGLIDPNLFTIEWGKFLANAQENLYATMIFYDPVELFGDEIGQQYNSMTALSGPNGDQRFTKVAPMVNTIGNYVITSSNPDPAAAVRWMDHFYSDEGALLYYMGVEGETFEYVDGKAEYTGDIGTPPEGSTFEQELAKKLTWLGGTQGLTKYEFSQASEAAPTSMEAAEKIKPYIPEDIFPIFTYTGDETDFLAGPGTDIDKYVVESRDKFISGDLSFDEWDSFVETLQNMQIEEYVEIRANAHERMTGN